MNHHHFPESVLVTDNQSARDPGSCEGLSQTQRETDPAFHSNSQYCVELLRAISSCWSLDCPGTAAAIRDNQPTGGMVRVSYRRSLSRSVMHSGDSSAKMNTESQASRRLLFVMLPQCWKSKMNTESHSLAVDRYPDPSLFDLFHALASRAVDRLTCPGTATPRPPIDQYHGLFTEIRPAHPIPPHAPPTRGGAGF